jgi:hypothetical protein
MMQKKTIPKFAPPTQMHLRNLILTYQSWINAEENKPPEGLSSPVHEKVKLGKWLIFELRTQMREGKFKQLPEGI